MRRFFAFIALALSLLVVSIIGVTSISDSIKNGTEFNGGYTIAYHLTDKDNISYKGNALKNYINKATKNLNERLNTLNVSNPEIAIVDDDYIHITVADVGDDQLNVIRYALANNGNISVRDTNDNDLMPEGYTASDVIKSIDVLTSGTQVYLNVKLKEPEIFHEISEKLAASYTGSSENPTVNMVIWLGFEESYTDETKEFTGFDGDSYANASQNPYAAFKILSQVAVDSHIEEDFSIQSSISIPNVRLMNKILDQHESTYVLNEQYTSKVGSYRSENTPNAAIIAGIIGLVVICALLVVFYKFSGLVASLSTISYAIITLYLYTAFGGLFGAETIIGMIVGIVLAVGANVIFLERIKDEIKKGKKLERAYEEGAKKSVSTVLDSNVLILIAALALYLFGTQVIKSFSAILIISQVVIVLVVVLLTRAMFGLLCKSTIVKNTRKLFGVKEDEIRDINDFNSTAKETKFDKINFVNNGKKKALFTSAFVVLAIVVGIIFQLARGSFYNFTASSYSGTKIYFRTVNSEYATSEKVSAKFEELTTGNRTPSYVVIGTETVKFENSDLKTYSELFAEYNVDVNTVSRDRVTVYDVTVYYSRVLDANSVDSINTVFEKEQLDFYNKDATNKEDRIELFKTNYTIGSYRPLTMSSAILNGLLALAMVIVFIGIYLTIRFSFAYALTTAASLVLNELVFLAFIALFRITTGTEFIGLALGLGILTINNLSVTFDKLRENISEARDFIWNKDTRSEYINKALQETGFGHVFTSGSGLVMGISLLALTLTYVFSLSFLFIIVVLISVLGSYFLMPHIWVALDTVHAKSLEARKARKARKAKPVVKSNEAEEYVFFGIND